MRRWILASRVLRRTGDLAFACVVIPVGLTAAALCAFVLWALNDEDTDRYGRSTRGLCPWH